MPTPLLLGSARDDGGPVELDVKHLLRHMMALGSSGSGKTVLCKVVVEECVRRGIPAICVDPQGDLCSLALAADNPDLLREKGVDPDLAQAFAERADVVVFTPAVRKGVPICADPVQGGVEDLPAEERVFALSGMAGVLAGLLGYRLDSNDGEGLVAVFELALNELFEAGRFPRNLADFTAYFSALDSAAQGRYERLLDANTLEQAQRRLARLDVGARRMLFHEGLALDIDLLLGRGDDSAALPGKTRVSVIYLNSLTSQEDKTFFVAALADRLYRWMLQNPSKTPQALFYIDEVAPFIPPVRQPASKRGLSLIFKQARKYGVSCLMATQNPGDVDYKAMAQFGTWAVGRLTTVQDIKRIEPTLKSLDPVNVDSLHEALPRLQSGEFFLLAPDAFEQTQALQTRWLYTKHETLTEERIEKLADVRWRERFAALEIPLALPPDPSPSGRGEQAPSPPGEGLGRGNEGSRDFAPQPSPFPLPQGEEMEADPQNIHYAQQLARSCSMSTQEFASMTGLSENKARGVLKTLVAEKLAGSFREGRSIRYWAVHTRLRPDLGLCRKVTALAPRITRRQAEDIAHDRRERKLFGILGDEERVMDITLEYHVCLRLKFREKVAKGLLGKLFRSKDEARHRRKRTLKEKLWRSFTDTLYEERAESVYLHPHTLHILTWDPGRGIRLEERPAEQASDILDFDAADMEERLPGELVFDERDWSERREDTPIKKQFMRAYDVSPQSIEPVFIPVWRLHLRETDEGGVRIVTVDALSGKPLAW